MIPASPIPLKAIHDPGAVIFDFDGVVANTESLHFATFSRVVRQDGIVLGPGETQSTYLGLTDSHCFQLAYEKAGRFLNRAECAALVERKAALFRAEIGSIELLPGVERVIRLAAARGPMTIASCGTAGDISAILEHRGLRELFPEFVSAEKITRSKPDPECFLAAFDHLRVRRAGLAPEDCLVFEDSIRGVEAARRAGMRCVAITSTHSRDELEAADEVIDSFESWAFWDD